METIFRTRYLSVIAVIFGAIGATLMFVIGAVSTIEVIAVLLAVLFLKGVLMNPDVVFADLVVPVAVVLLAWTVWLIRRAETH